jgi:hypothetical protein
MTNLMYYHGTYVERLSKITNIMYDSLSSGQDLCRGRPEYETEVLITLVRRSVSRHSQ